MQRKTCAQMLFEMRHSNVLMHLALAMVSMKLSLISLASHSTFVLVQRRPLISGKLIMVLYNGFGDQYPGNRIPLKEKILHFQVKRIFSMSCYPNTGFLLSN